MNEHSKQRMANNQNKVLTNLSFIGISKTSLTSKFDPKYIIQRHARITKRKIYFNSKFDN